MDIKGSKFKGNMTCFLCKGVTKSQGGIGFFPISFPLGCGTQISDILLSMGKVMVVYQVWIKLKSGGKVLCSTKFLDKGK